MLRKFLSYHFLPFLMFVFLSCDLPDNTEEWYNTPEIFGLQLENYSFSLYRFSTSSMYNDSYYNGYTILENNRTFTLNDIEELDFDLIEEHPSNDTLKVIKLIPPEDRLQLKKSPTRITFQRHGELVIQTEHLEEFSGYSTTNANAHWYTFSALTEKMDSVVFHGTISRYKTNIHKNSDSIVLPKRNLYFNLDRNGNPASIDIQVLIEETADLFIYESTTNVLESTVKDGFVRITRSYEFTPADSSVNVKLSDTGVFKEIR